MAAVRPVNAAGNFPLSLEADLIATCSGSPTSFQHDSGPAARALFSQNPDRTDLGLPAGHWPPMAHWLGIERCPDALSQEGHCPFPGICPQAPWMSACHCRFKESRWQAGATGAGQDSSQAGGGLVAGSGASRWGPSCPGALKAVPCDLLGSRVAVPGVGLCSGA